MDAGGLVEGLPDRGGYYGVLAARDMCQGIAHPVNAAALSCRLKDQGDGGHEAGTPSVGALLIKGQI